MRSTFAGLNTVVRGINANRLSLDTVGHNITNGNTEGYSRQRVNLAATRPLENSSAFGKQLVGTGVDTLSLMRARNIHADKQYWKENANNEYFESREKNYDKLEVIFNDSTGTGLKSSLEKFYSSWVDLSANASTASNRTTVIEMGRVFADRLKTVTRQVQSQIRSNYDDMTINVKKINELTDGIVKLNKEIASLETTGANANDLRDQRDVLVDTLSGYTDIYVYEQPETKMYAVVSNGTTLVNGISKLNLKISEPATNRRYGVGDRDILVAETNTLFSPQSGLLKSNLDAITENKEYIDKLSELAITMFTALNTQHRKGFGIKGKDIDPNKHEINFFGETGETFTFDNTKQCITKGGDDLYGVEIVEYLHINTAFTKEHGVDYVAAASPDKGTMDGSNAVEISKIFNTKGQNGYSIESYYNAMMTKLGVDSQEMKQKGKLQVDVMEQIKNWRESTSAVNWNEELTDMIRYQKGYSSSARCLTAMDEMLDRLINSTGVVGR